MASSSRPGARAPWLPGPPVAYSDAFRANISTFLKDYGQRVAVPFLKNVNVFLVRLSNEAYCVNLHVYEERLKAGEEVCDHCRNIGWQHHPVCSRRYHFVIPSEEDLADAASVPAIVECKAAGRSIANVKWSVLDGGDEDADQYTAPASVFDSKTH